MKRLQLCDDFQFTTSRWLISFEHRLGLLSKGEGKLTKYLKPLRKFLDVDLLVFPADGTKPILPVREVAAVFADSDVAPPVGHVDQFNKWNFSPNRVVLEHNKKLKHTDRDRHRQTHTNTQTQTLKHTQTQTNTQKQTLKHKTPWMSSDQFFNCYSSAIQKYY